MSVEEDGIERLEKGGVEGALKIWVSVNSEYGMLICTITHIITININMHVTSRCVGAAWACVALPRGLECHVTSTWVPHENIPPFSCFLFVLIIKKLKINSEKSEKIPRN